jgi:predicted lipoprotein with Yx(FWY)xxD motif
MNRVTDPPVDHRTRREEAPMRQGRLGIVAVVATLALATAACSNGEDVGDGTPSPEPSVTAEATVAVQESDLGQIVVDAEGRTLYVFLVDEGSESACYDECEDNWPPLTVDGEPVAGEGIDGSLLGTSARTDGSMQVTLDGHPLYLFGGDQAAGDVNGQGVSDVWFVVSPSGRVIKG